MTTKSDILRFTLPNGHRVSCMMMPNGKLWGATWGNDLADAMTTLNLMREAGFRAIMTNLGTNHGFVIEGEKKI